MMTWRDELERLEALRDAAQGMGGPERLERQRKAGRLNARERITLLLDDGSFQEVGSISGTIRKDAGGEETFSPANCIIGRGRIDSRAVIVAVDDFTVRGGSADGAIWEKFKLAERMATEWRLPLLRLVEGSGGGGSVRTIEKAGYANLPGGLGGASGGLNLCAQTMNEVPVVALGLGPVAGLGAARVCMSHFSILVKEISSLFVAGPPVVEQLGETSTKEGLGGAAKQAAAGVIDHVADSEADAFAAARRFLSYLPNSVHDLPPRGSQDDTPTRREEALLSIVPREPDRAYMMRKIIHAIVDQGSLLELSAGYGRSVITGLARLDGWPIALLAGDPVSLGGAWTAAAAQKIARFVEFAGLFHLPVVHLVDCPGLRVGSEAESLGTLRAGCRAVAAIHDCPSPWCSIIVRNVFGVGGGAHQPQNGVPFRYSWPSARWGSLPLQGGIEAAYRAELDAAPDRAAALGEIEGRLDALRSPLRTAQAFGVEEIIDPRDTRPLLCEFANLAAPLRTPGRVRFAHRP